MSERPSPRGGLVLAGGQSRRMGSAKAWLPFGPERLLQRIVRLVGESVDELIVVAAPGQILPALPDQVRIVADVIAGQGPLRGLASGLAAFSLAVEFVYVSATDAPLLQPGWIDGLARLLLDHELVIPEHDGRLHPLAAIYRCTPTLAAAESLLAAGSSRMTSLIDRLDTRIVATATLAEFDPDLASLRNLNRPDDHVRALRAAGFENHD